MSGSLTSLIAGSLAESYKLRVPKGWTTTDDLEHDPTKLEKIAKKAKRNKLVYSGISA